MHPGLSVGSTGAISQIREEKSGARMKLKSYWE